MSAAPEIATAQRALQLAEEWGLPVFPVKLIRKSDGTTKKVPLTSNGFYGATTNLEQISLWWKQHPEAAVGVPTGKATKMFMVDIDPAGEDWYKENVLRLECGRVHRTMRGFHLLYRMPEGVDISSSAGKIVTGVDVRANGGYMVWWPATGGECVGGIDDINLPPKWLLDLILESKTRKATVTALNTSNMIGEGQRNDFLSREAYRQKRMGATLNQIYAALDVINQTRCDPPVDADELKIIIEGKRHIEPEVSTVTEMPWTARLRVSKKGVPLPDEANSMIALRYAPELAMLVRFNEFSRKVEFAKSPPWRTVSVGAEWTDQDDTELLCWFQHVGIAMRSRSSVLECIGVCANEHSYHPVRDYLNARQWDCTPRLDSWLSQFLGAKGDEQYLAAIGRRWLVSAVARVMEPGCQADHTLVLEGLQGAGKSRTARALAVNPEWFVDRLPDLHTADAADQLRGRWIVEVAELAAIRHTSSIESSKAYLTRTFDSYRPAYGRRTINAPRQCVFIGSTNEDTYLRDRTGNRRYWPVRCGAIDIQRLEREVPQLWAEAVEAYRNGEKWYLDAEQSIVAEQEQDDRVILSELEQQVAEYLDRQRASNVLEVEMKDILVHALNLEPDKSDYSDKAGKYGPQAAIAAKSQGWHRVGVKGRGKTRRVLYRFLNGIGG